MTIIYIIKYNIAIRFVCLDRVSYISRENLSCRTLAQISSFGILRAEEISRFENAIPIPPIPKFWKIIMLNLQFPKETQVLKTGF